MLPVIQKIREVRTPMKGSEGIPAFEMLAGEPTKITQKLVSDLQKWWQPINNGWHWCIHPLWMEKIGRKRLRA